MNENKKAILMKIIGSLDFNSDDVKNDLMWNFNDFNVEFHKYEMKFKDEPKLLKDILECHQFVCNMYRTMIMNYINEFSETIYGQSIGFIINNNSQENIIMRLESFLNTKGVSKQFKCDVFENIKVLAETLDKRFSFDETALINLIEASMGKNIIVEAGHNINNNGKVLLKTSDGYKFKQSTDEKKYTHDGSRILDPKGQERTTEENIQITSYPLGNIFSNTNDALKKVMQVLFENLNLCIETYNSIYSSGDNKVENTALLADGTTFDFEFIVNEYNIPHLLGIQPGYTLSQKSIDYLNLIAKANNKPKRKGNLIRLSQKSGALDVLLVIYENQNNIIECGGLYEDNGKKYEIINWEKVILKTSSFMRGDFFKTCFCLTKLAENKYLASKNEKGGYVSISSTEYSKGLNSFKSTRAILNDLLNTTRQKKDFIFRGFVTDRDGKQRINSIMTGKSETIHVGKNSELLKTLQKYRDMLFGSGTGWFMEQKGESINGETGMPFNDSPIDKELLFASIVEEIENEKFIRKFTPEEQAELGLSISKDLSLIPTLSKDALSVLQDVHSQSDAVTATELDEFESARRNGQSK